MFLLGTFYLFASFLVMTCISVIFSKNPVNSVLFLFFLFALVKAIVPRYRYDQLMRLGWKILLPFSLIYLVLTASFLFYFDKLPKGNF